MLSYSRTFSTLLLPCALVAFVGPGCGDDGSMGMGPTSGLTQGGTMGAGPGPDSTGSTSDGSDPGGPSDGPLPDSSGTGEGEACPENPCANEGTCTLVDERPQCTCTRDFWGPTCENPRFVSTIFQGNNQALAIDSSGIAWTWEIDSAPIMLDPIDGLVAVTLNPEHVTKNRTRLGLDEQGEVWSWSGLEITAADQRALPAVMAMATSEYYALFADEGGGLWQLQLVDGVQSIDEVSDVLRVVVGNSDLVVTAGGTVWQRPHATLTMTMPPWTELDFLPPDIVEVAVTPTDPPDHYLALDASGTIWGWGSNEFGQLGTGAPSAEPVLDPVMVEGLVGVVDVGVGDGFSMALTDDGRVWAWGFGAGGQLGDGIAERDHTRWLPHEVLNVTDALAISTGEDRGLALLDNGAVVQWGEGQFSADHPTPHVVPLPSVAP